MKTNAILLFFLAITLAHSIGQYDFNTCRISNCNAEQLNCLSDESGCLNYFAVMRNCFATCGDAKNWNSCWSSCKNSPARTNAYYLSLSLCYENLCYLWEKWVLGIGLLTIPLMIMI